MRSFSVVYDLFFSKITDDMYMELTKEDTMRMVEDLLNSAVHSFEFPRKSLERVPALEDEEGYFISDLTEEECNILATYMVEEWIGQQLASVENTRMKYSGSDFKFTSQANHMAKLQSLKKEYERKGFHLQRLYKRRKVDSKGVYRSTMHTIMESPIYPFSKGNEDPSGDDPGEEDYWYDS